MNPLHLLMFGAGLVMLGVAAAGKDTPGRDLMHRATRASHRASTAIARILEVGAGRMSATETARRLRDDLELAQAGYRAAMAADNVPAASRAADQIEAIALRAEQALAILATF